MRRSDGRPLPALTSLDRQRKWRHALVVVLTFLTGSADAMGFVALGGAFSSVMTGNMVLLGLSAGNGDPALALTSGLAIASFIIGVLVGARVAGSPQPGDPVWPRWVTRALAVELMVYGVFLVGWEVNLSARSEQIKLILLGLSAIALGLQSSAVQRLGVPGLSSTYLTGTLTNLIGGIAARSPWKITWPKAQILLALMFGAAIGAVTAVSLPALAPILLIGPLVSVIGIGRRLTRQHAGEVEGAERRTRAARV